MLIGYARVSTQDQDTTLQIEKLKEAGCEKIFAENASGGETTKREQLKLLMDHLRRGDTVIVWKIDRFSRSLRDLLRLLEALEKRHAGFRSLTEPVDTTTPAGRMMIQMLGAVAEFERAMIRERSRAGVERARSVGRHPGRKPALTKEQQRAAIDMVMGGGKTRAEVGRLFGVDRSTISRLVSAHQDDAIHNQPQT